MTWNTILVPHDFSASANHALAIARDEAKLHKAKIVLFHVIDLPHQIGPDAVNVASRVEGLTKEHGVDVLISETTWDQLGDTRRGRRLAAETIRGRKEPVVLYALDDEPPNALADQPSSG